MHKGSSDWPRIKLMYSKNKGSKPFTVRNPIHSSQLVSLNDWNYRNYTLMGTAASLLIIL